MKLKHILLAVFCLVFPSHSLEMLLEISVDEVYCEACIAGMKKKPLAGIKKVEDYIHPAFARFELKEDANLEKTLKSLAENNYTIHRSWLLLKDAKLSQTPAGPMIKTKSQSICIKGIETKDLDTKPWFRAELIFEENMPCLIPAEPLEAQ